MPLGLPLHTYFYLGTKMQYNSIIGLKLEVPYHRDVTKCNIIEDGGYFKDQHSFQ